MFIWCYMLKHTADQSSWQALDVHPDALKADVALNRLHDVLLFGKYPIMTTVDYVSL